MGDHAYAVRMSERADQVNVWDAASTTKSFRHPVDLTWLADVDPLGRVLDYGCGYGRVTADLREHGFTNIIGVDTSPMMINQARRLHPDLTFHTLDNPPQVSTDDATIDLVMLVAVLTCVPEDGTQQALISEIARVLKPGGLLHISDMPLQDDPRNQERYARYQDIHGTYGVFETDDGFTCRHHSMTWLNSLLTGFDILKRQYMPVVTMNGHQARGIQLLAAKPHLT